MIAFGMLLCLPGWSQTLDPQVISPAGNSLRDANFQVDWTLGQIVSEMLQGTNFVVSQGFEQPAFLATAIEVSILFDGIRIFPNPTEDRLWITFPKRFENPPQITLTNMLGQEVLQASWPFSEQQMLLDISELPAANYLLRLLDPETQKTASFHILKIN